MKIGTDFCNDLIVLKVEDKTTTAHSKRAYSIFTLMLYTEKQFHFTLSQCC